MSGSHSPPLDGVPVVLTDKWRLPPLPEISEDLVEKFFLPNFVGEYSFELENAVLDKISRWQDARRIAREAREERIKVRSEEKRKYLEVEETKLKERLTQISYDFSSSSDSETETESEERAPKVQPVSFSTILTPTVVAESQSKAPVVPLWNGNASRLELADFEKAPDPFDNMELKTIDDLDVLAQILKTSNVTPHSEKADQDDQKPQTPPPPPKNDPPQPITNGYAPSYATYYGYPFPVNSQPCYAPLHPSPGQMYANSYTNYAPYFDYGSPPEEQQQQETAASKLKSKSVPDIVKELEDEVNDSKQRRMRNNSQCADKSVASGNENSSYNKQHITSCDDTQTTIQKLPKEVRNLVMEISQMGFPMDRVSRVATQFRGDDKKIIEHLIPLSELLDLGFEEKRISEALIKFDNNKEKALDFLISN